MSNFTDSGLYQKVSNCYLEDYWKLFVKQKCYNRVSKIKFEEFLQLNDTPLYILLCQKELVKEYDEQLANILRTSDQTCDILVSKFLEESGNKYFLPTNFSSEEYEVIFQRYINSENPNPKVLNLIFDAPINRECPISAKLKLIAKHRFNKIWNDPDHNAISIMHGINISFSDQKEIFTYTHDEGCFNYSYDIKWLEDNKDYPTILNNFIYVFNMFDSCFRSTLVSVKSNIGVLEEAIRPKGVKFYPRGNLFNHYALLSSIQMDMYSRLLKKLDIDLEHVFEWFFETYLPEEFNVIGFKFKPSSASDYVEKCRNLAAEMDGILKQFRMYVQDGEINRELFEMGSEPLRINGIPSLISNKYAYAKNNSILNEMYFLFSDQSRLYYTQKFKAKYNSLSELLCNEEINETDFHEFQRDDINWLKTQGALVQNEVGVIKLNSERVSFLKDLYDHDVSCVQYWKSSDDIINQMKTKGEIRIESTLFSEPERDYLNFMLNKAEYSDGFDLRNKYAHSTYPQDSEVQYDDYIYLLKIMVLVITKINEEFCLYSENKQNEKR